MHVNQPILPPPQPQQQQYQNATPNNTENNFKPAQIDNIAFSEDQEDKEFMKEIRRGFIIKVYSILVVCLLFTAIICVAPTVSTSVQNFLEDNIWILILSAVLSFVPLCTLMYFTKLARKVPINYILLFTFVLFESIIVAYSCASVQSPELVLIAALMTGGLTLILTVFACTTKIDFTLCWGAAFIMGGTLLMFGIFAIILRSEILYLMYISFGIIVYGFYLLIDTQLVCGGKTWQLSEEDYIIGALILYIDIIILFIKILALLSKTR